LYETRCRPSEEEDEEERLEEKVVMEVVMEKHGQAGRAGVEDLFLLKCVVFGAFGRLRWKYTI